jgi:hypothetical protein
MLWSVRGIAAAFVVLLVVGICRPANSAPSPITPAVYKLLKADDEVCWEEQFLDQETGFWTIPRGRDAGYSGKEILKSLNDLLVKRDTGEPYTTEIVPGSDMILVHAVGKQVRWKIYPVPCPPPFTGFSGLSGSVYGLKASGLLQWAERLASTGEQTNSGSAHGDPLGVGFSAGYGFTPWHNSIVVEPFASVDFPNIKVNQNFPGSSYLGTRANYDVIGGFKIGPTVAPGLWLYGIAGAGLLNEKLTINFVPLSSSTTATVGGGTLGAGLAIMPGSLQGFGRPVSLSFEYQHEWWDNAHYNTPAASSLFNYTFRRQDDVFKFGFSVY